ncbi:MBL fold metallo-hydrolase [Yoonia sp.]|uniref:MBL fold metallo-hydrolase n=1 Tax=Yoonia sp. TaxID=2212373 RepID=UPI002FD9118A
MKTGDNPVPGVPETLAPGIVRIVAPNPSPMTYWGTNAYLLGESDLVVIDPGPDLPAHYEALLAAMAGRRVSHILVTHSHLDHSPLAARLAAQTGAPVCAFGRSTDGRSAMMTSLAQGGLVGGGEGLDHAFAPDVTLADGAVIDSGAGPITALHTPGHIGNHMCFLWQDGLFCGDHVMGWASSLVSPPDGDLGDFLASCARLSQTRASRFFPGHGATIDTPRARLDWLVQHRHSRTRAILAALGQGPADARSLTLHIYRETPAALLKAAERNVLAHLLHLHDKGQVRPDGALHVQSVFRLV